MNQPDRTAFAAALGRAIDDAFAIDPDGRADRAKLEALAMDTFDWAVARGFDPSAQMVFENDFDWCVEIATRHPASTPPELLQRWKAWAETYSTFAADHPRLEMLSIMKDLSHTIFGGSWITTDESILMDWADQPSHLPPPRFVAPGYIEASIHRRLKALRHRTGGWLHLAHDNSGRIVFAPDAQWRAWRDETEAANQRRKQEREAHADWQAVRDRRVLDAVHAARADAATWDALKAWEKSQPAVTLPPDGRNLTRLIPSSPSGVVTLTPVSHADIEGCDAAVTVDPIFGRFFDRLRRPAEPFPVLEALQRLRMEVRSELGLPLTFVTLLQDGTAILTVDMTEPPSRGG